MTTPVTAFNVLQKDGTSWVKVDAEKFVFCGDVVQFLSSNGQTVAAFASGQWQQILPESST